MKQEYRQSQNRNLRNVLRRSFSNPGLDAVQMVFPHMERDELLDLLEDANRRNGTLSLAAPGVAVSHAYHVIDYIPSGESGKPSLKYRCAARLPESYAANGNVVTLRDFSPSAFARSLPEQALFAKRACDYALQCWGNEICPDAWFDVASVTLVEPDDFGGRASLAKRLSIHFATLSPWTEIAQGRQIPLRETLDAEVFLLTICDLVANELTGKRERLRFIACARCSEAIESGRCRNCRIKLADDPLLSLPGLALPSRVVLKAQQAGHRFMVVPKTTQ